MPVQTGDDIKIPKGLYILTSQQTEQLLKVEARPLGFMKHFEKIVQTRFVGFEQAHFTSHALIMNDFGQKCELEKTFES